MEIRLISKILKNVKIELQTSASIQPRTNIETIGSPPRPRGQTNVSVDDVVVVCLAWVPEGVLASRLGLPVVLLPAVRAEDVPLVEPDVVQEVLFFLTFILTFD